MGYLELALIGVGLSMDAFAVSVSKGLGMRKLNKKQPVFLQAVLCLSHTVSVLFLSMDILFTVRQDSRNHCPVYSASPSDQQYMQPLHHCLF